MASRTPASRVRGDVGHRGRGRGSVASVLAEARASLAHPSRPITPVDDRRTLFSDATGRPVSALPMHTTTTLLDPMPPLAGTRSGERATQRPPSARTSSTPGVSRASTVPEVVVVRERTVEHSTNTKMERPASTPPPFPSKDSSGGENKVNAFLTLVGSSQGATLCRALEGVNVELSRGKELEPPGSTAAIGILLPVLQCGDGAAVVRAALAMMKIAGKTDASVRLSVFRALFRVSKTQANDEAFLHEGVLELILRLFCDGNAPVSESLVYAGGTLKNITLQTCLLSKLIDLNLSCIMARALHVHQSESGERVAQFLVQVTAILRNVATTANGRKRLLESGAVAALCQLVDAFEHHRDIMLNLSRVLSKVTLLDEICDVVLQDLGNFQRFTSVLARYPTDTALIVRLGFSLSNLTEQNMEARLQLFRAGAAEVVWLVLDGLLSREGSGERERIDAMTKMIRLVANMSITYEIRCEIAASSSTSLLRTIMERYAGSWPEWEELILNTVAAITNLSSDTRSDLGLWNDAVALSDRSFPLLLPLLVCDHVEAVVESARAFGNFSRDPNVRDSLLPKGADEIFLLLLDHSDHEVLLPICGVLMNVAGHKRWLDRLQENGVVERLVDVLWDAGALDTRLAVCVCQALFNLCITQRQQQWGPILRNVLLPLRTMGSADLLEVTSALLELFPEHM